MSDGNQTLGTSYRHLDKQFSIPIYPLVLGDTMQYIDLKIKQINLNPYTFWEILFLLKFLSIIMEVIIEVPVLEIFKDKTLVYKEKLQFSALDNSKVITPKLKASKVGLQRFIVKLHSLTYEKVVSEIIVKDLLLKLSIRNLILH